VRKRNTEIRGRREIRRNLLSVWPGAVRRRDSARTG